MNKKREKYSYYEYSVFHAVGEIKQLNEVWEGWVYEIYTNCPDYKYYELTDVLKESDEWYETEEEARHAAIDEIDKLESGE